jgi:hypothetical protein
MLRYFAYLEEPTLASYRLDYCPRDALATVLICPWVVVTGETDTTYNVMRALPLPESAVSVSFGAYRGSDRLDEVSPFVYSFADFPAVQRYRVSEPGDAVVYSGDSFSLSLGISSYAWTEASGRVSLRARRLGQACTFWVPEQPGIEHPLLSRSHLGFVEGEIDGDPVTGIFMCDLIYSRPGLTFKETNFTRDLHNYWMNWLVEYEDGSLEGGFAWRGRRGFAVAHHYVDDTSYARTDASLTIERTATRGTMERVGLRLGSDVEVALDQHGSTDWPLHTYGTVSSISRRKAVRRSWNYSENFPLNWGDVEDFQAAYARLHGRYPSLQGLLDGARVIDERIALA